jgi:UDP-glucose 4-epimerase
VSQGTAGFITEQQAVYPEDLVKKNAQQRQILVTGGAGYIGSHMIRLLAKNGFVPVVFDNLSTGHRQLVPRDVPFVKGDIRDVAALKKLFAQHKFHGVIHFAGLIAVGESVKEPFKYYDNNVTGSLRLIEAVAGARVPYFIFSSTAAVYGPVKSPKIPETALLAPGNPYGATKLVIERVVSDMAAVAGFRYALPRYFNASGAHPSADTGEWHEPETHLIPNILLSILDKRPFQAFGRDYPTQDGTCIRDYIHVEDLCDGHLAALKALEAGKPSGPYNLGTGRGYSILEVVKAVERVTGRKVDLRFAPRRAGDAARLVADPGKASKVLGWKAEHGLDDIIASAWRWQQKLSS